MVLPTLPISVLWSTKSNPLIRSLGRFGRPELKVQTSVSQYYRTFNVVQFAKRMDALFDLLDVTADALAATWDQQAEVPGEETFHVGDNIKPTIH